MITFKKIPTGYEASTKYFNFETEKYEAVYTILKDNKDFKVLNKNVEVEEFKKLADAKEFIENEDSKIVQKDEIEEGFAEGGGWSAGVCITSSGKGSSWYKDENGNIIDN